MGTKPQVRLEIKRPGEILNTVYRHPLFSLIIVGFLVRYALAPYTSWTYDVETWYRTAMNIVTGTGLYDSFYFVYPPVWGYILGGLIKLFTLFFDPTTFAYYVRGFEMVTSPLFNLAFKTPLFVADALVGFVIYRFILEITRETKKAKTGFFLWFLNPLAILISSVHGTIDSIPSLFTLLTIVFMYKQKYLWAGSTLALGILSKIFPAFLVPLVIGFILADSNVQSYGIKLNKVIRSYSLFIIGSLTTTIIIIFPFLLQGTWRNALEVILSRNEVISPGGLSPWVFLILFPQSTMWTQDNMHLIISYSIVIGFLSTSVIGVLFFYFSHKDLIKWLIWGSIATISIIYLTTPIVLPQYFLWVMPFLVIGYLTFEKSYKYIYILLNISGITYFFLTNGYWHLLYPLATFTKIINLEFIIQGTATYLGTNGLISNTLRDDIILLLGLMATGTMVLSLLPNGPRLK